MLLTFFCRPCHFGEDGGADGLFTISDKLVGLAVGFLLVGGAGMGLGSGCRTIVIRSGYFFHAPVAASTIPKSNRKKLAMVAGDSNDDKTSSFGW